MKGNSPSRRCSRRDPSASPSRHANHGFHSVMHAELSLRPHRLARGLCREPRLAAALPRPRIVGGERREPVEQRRRHERPADRTLRRATPRRKRATANVSPVRRGFAGALNRASWRDRIAACGSARAGSSVRGGHGLAHRSSESRRRSAASAAGARARQPAQAGRRRRLGLGIRPAESRVRDDTSRRVRSAEDKAVIRRNVEISG